MLNSRNVGISWAQQKLSEMTAKDAVADKPNSRAYAKAQSVLQLAELLEIDPTSVTASAEGGIGLCFKANGMYADIECFNSGEIWAIISDRIKPAATWAVDDSNASIADALLKIKNGLNLDA